MVRLPLAVVIPCHNEAATLGPVVRLAARHADVIVVDDRSSDASAQVAADNGALVIASAAAGYDGALDTGLRRAFADDYAFVVTMDADGEHDPALIARFKSAFDGGAELICGYRPRPQRLAEHVVGAIGAAFFGVRDMLCGMKGYSRTALKLYLDSGLPLMVNMTPTLLWRRAGRAHVQIAVTGEQRADAPRFGRALAANLAILRAFGKALSLTRTAKGKP